MFKQRIRLPINFSKPQFPVERSQFRLANGDTKVLSAVVRNTYEGKTDHLPEDWHRKLVIALNHDEVTIEDTRLLTGVSMEGDYSIDWQDFLNNPVAQSTFTVQVTPFNATNSNCQSCTEIAQVELVDDYTEDIFEEGGTYDYPVSVLDNDNICCYPFVVELVSFNTAYISAASITQAGILTFTLLALLPTITDVLLATYRVTCDNGGYDEANVYGNIEGDSTECAPPSGVTVSPVGGGDDTLAIATWIPASPAPAAGYNWFLYLQPDIYTVIQSGTTIDLSVNLTGLTPGANYLFAVQADCGDGQSAFITFEFTMPSGPTALCGKYLVTYIPIASIPSQTMSYIDCDGNLQGHVFPFSQSFELCILESSAGIPVYSAVSTSDITIIYIEPC